MSTALKKAAPAATSPVIDAFKNAPMGPPDTPEEKRAIAQARRGGGAQKGSIVSAEISARRCPPTTR